MNRPGQNRDWLPGLWQKAGSNEPRQSACPGFVRALKLASRAEKRKIRLDERYVKLLQCAGLGGPSKWLGSGRLEKSSPAEAFAGAAEITAAFPVGALRGNGRDLNMDARQKEP